MSPSFSRSKCETAEERAEILFFEALQRPPAEHREFLDRECGADVKLRSDVEDLLRVHHDTGSFLKIGAAASPDFEAAFAGYKPEIAGDCIGPYKLLEQIGEGGFGRVWVAEQARPIRRRVALKIIKLGMDTKEVIARFEQERQALAMMDHPHIAKVLDAGATPTGRPFFVMELVRGTKVTDYCDEAQLSTGERLKLFIQVCSAVQHAHQKGIIHRDLKPSNILVTLHDGVPVPKVIDFGVAKATQQQRLTELTIYTQFEQMIGTPLYMAPEQAEMSGFDIDTRSDIYSLGVLLYELLTGRTPFDPERLMKAGFDEMRRVIREEEPQKPSTFVSTMTHEHRSTVARLRRSAEGAKLISAIRGDLDWIVMKALEKNRNRRYETANALARDIERHLRSEPVQARPASASYRFRRFIGRNKGVATAGAAVAAALILGSAVSLWQAVRAQTALDELRSSAPAFAEQARSLAARERFEEAIKKLDYAIKLRPDVVDYALAKANILQSQFRFAEAASLYRGALRLNPSEKRAEANAALCEKLAREAAAQPKLSRQSLVELLNRMNHEQRLAAEMLLVGRLLGEESKLLRSLWMERLKDLPISPDRPLQDRLVSTKAGLLALDLSGTSVADLSPLKGMPLERLILAGCENVNDLRPLGGMPLRHLVLGRNGGDHSAAAFRPCGIRDVSALAGLPLVSLDLEGIKLDDLTPLRGMPLEWLNLRETSTADLTPLKGMPLKHLDCTLIRARDFTPLIGAPLEVLNLQSTPVGDLAFMRGMPLKSVLLNGCVEARGYQVLSEIPTLESAMLPAGIAELPITEMNAVGELRNHPALRRIQIGGSRQEGMAAINTEVSEASFWARFDADLSVRHALAQLVGEEARYKRLKVTWEVFLEGLPISDISLLKGIPISTLVLTGTNVTDLTPLADMKALRVLHLSGTGVRNLEPLKGLELIELYLENCAPGLDISPVSEISTLQHVLLPPDPRNLERLQKHPNLKRVAYHYDGYSRQILLTAEEFWSHGGRYSVESAARSGRFALAENILRSQESGSPMDWIALGAVILAQGDEMRYRAHCKKVIEIVQAQNVPPNVAVMVCLLSPRSGIPLKDLETLLKMDRATGPAWKQLSSALLAYRDIRYKEALKDLQGLPPRVKDRIDSAPTASAIAAMCHMKLQNTKAAHAELERARQAVALFWPEGSEPNAAWWDGLIAYLLLKEAEGLISNPADSLRGAGAAAPAPLRTN